MDYENKHKEEIIRATQLWECGDITRENLEYIFPELSEDEKIRKAIIRLVEIDKESMINNVTTDSMLSWLKKQDKKPQGKTALETWKNMRLEVYQQASGNRHEPNYSDDTTKMFSLNDIDEIIEKISEQKLADKVEPRFHEGDWVVTCANSVVQIKAINSNNYVLENTMRFNIAYVDKYWHSWTIADAKDGDFLATKNFIFVFKNIDNGNGVHYYCHYEINKHEDDNQFGIALPQSLMGRVGNNISHYFPATKEQRDLLFQKMKENNWEWDAEAKKLNKKLETFPILSNSSKTGKEWTEEDEHHWMMCLECVEECATQKRKDFSKTISWLKQLKQRMEQ